MYQFKFQIPPYYTLLVRSLSVLEVRCAACALLRCACTDPPSPTHATHPPSATCLLARPGCRASPWQATASTKCLARPTPGWRAAC